MGSTADLYLLLPIQHSKVLKHDEGWAGWSNYEKWIGTFVYLSKQGQHNVGQQHLSQEQGQDWAEVCNVVFEVLILIDNF